MSDIKTFSNFKDWVLILLIGANVATQLSINTTVNEQAKSTAVHQVKIQELEDDVDEIKVSMKPQVSVPQTTTQKITNNDIR